MKPIDNWRRQYPKLWSVRLWCWALGFMATGIGAMGFEILAGTTADPWLKFVLSSVGVVLGVLGIVARFVAQPELHDGDRS